MTTLTEALAIVKTAMNDPALRASILAQLGIEQPSVMREVKPLPAISQITAVQASIWDNWPFGKAAKGYPNRYAMTVEVWTAEADAINVGRKNDQQHKVNMALMDRANFSEWLARTTKQNATRRHPLSAAYLESLSAIPDSMDDDDLVGVCAVKQHGEGTVYHDDQFVMMTRGPDGWEAILFIGNEPLKLPTFVTRNAKDNPLAANVVGQSRLDRVGFSTAWATPDFTGTNVVPLRVA